MWTSVFEGLWARLYASGWVANAVVALVFLLLGPVWANHQHKPKYAIFSVAAGLTLIIWVFAILAWRSTPRGDRVAVGAVLPTPTTTAATLSAAASAPSPAKKEEPAPVAGSLHSSLTNSPNSTIYQAGRDVVINKPADPSRVIATLVVESRVTCTVKPGAELPPEKVEIGPWWGGDAELRGPAGHFPLKIASPVLFLRQGINRLVVVNRFYLPEDSPLRGRPVQALSGFDDLYLPVTTVVNTFSAALDRVNLLEVSIRMGNADPAYESYRYDVAFEEGRTLQFTVPLKPFLKGSE